MKKYYWILPLLLIMTMCSNGPKGQKVLIETSMGDIKVVLYDKTPLHRDNFIRLVNDGYYKNKNFHRVIKNFMIQAGATNTSKDSTFNKEELVDPEFRTPEYFHKAGVLAAARWGDDENPERKSSATQFYIVTGKIILDNQFQEIEKERLEKLKQSFLQRYQTETRDTLKAMYKEGNKTGIAELRAGNMERAEKEAENQKESTLFTEEQKEIYNRIGGVPHLDGAYTVFGEVYEGMDVAKKIENVETSPSDKPLEVVIIKNMSLIE